jgi:myosin-5
MLTAPEVQDEILDALVRNLRIPLPSTQSVAPEKEVLFPAHLLAFLIFKQLSHKVTDHMVFSLARFMKEIQEITMKFEDDYVSAFWLSNIHQLYCLLTTSLDQDVAITGKSQSATFTRNPDALSAIDQVRQDLDVLMNKVYEGWMAELKKRISNMIVPAVIENQSLPGYVCKQAGGLWGSWAKSSSSVQISIDQLVNFLSKLTNSMKCYYFDEKISHQVLTELVRVIGVSAFNHLIMRKNFCTWKRGDIFHF